MIVTLSLLSTQSWFGSADRGFTDTQPVDDRHLDPPALQRGEQLIFGRKQG
jgi:hypothetical protein